MNFKTGIKTIIFLLILSGCFQLTAQRKFEKLDRGVVAVRNSSSAYFISWRYLATDPEDIQYNLYAKKVGTSAFVKLNTNPLNVPNFQSTTTQVANGTQLYVTPLIEGVEGNPSGTFTINAAGFNSYRSAYLDISYNPAIDGLDLVKYSTKFVWPADLDGDGEYDFVVDRLSNEGKSHKIQAYLSNGTLLWTVDMGPNVTICEGQDDMVIAYDMDSDGKADVVVKSSDGTAFSNGKGVNGSTSLDTDGDGIINYNTQYVKNPPQYISVIDGLTGVEKTSIEMTYPSNYNRNNKADFMGEEYSNLNGHMVIIYPDGKHPAVGFVYKTRVLSKYHYYYASAWGYNAASQFVNLYNWERGSLDAAEFHSIRAADVDFDGRDELLNGGFGLKYDGSLAFNAHISHGDRFRVGDIDPARPGLETFAIQQNASNMLGMLLYESHTGNAIKKFYMSAVGDVGRGECMDIDSTHLGYEFYSTMPNIYNAKGEIIYEGSSPFPNEGVWWDGDLAREELNSADGNGFNADIRKYSSSSHAYGTRLIEFAKMTNWQVKSEYGRRPAFFGDIAGDWREEVLLEKKGSQAVIVKDINGNDSTAYVETCPGFVGFSTDYPTGNRLYCLMQNPAYRMQATTKGYYQSAFPDYYLGFKMPAPPVPPIMTAKLTWKSGTVLDKSASAFVLEDEKTSATYVDGDDIMFDISGNNAAPIQMNTDLAPLKVWAMNPLGKDYSITGSGKFTGDMELVKSMYGNFTLNGNHTYTGKTIVSEGKLTVNGSLASLVDIRAKGTLAGNAVLNGGITLNPGLNVEGGRIAPGNGLVADKLGKIVINSNVTVAGNVNLHFDIIPAASYKNDSLVIAGNLSVAGVNNIVINTLSGTLPSGTYSLIKWTGTFSGNVSNFNIEGISGLPVTLQIEDNTLKLVVNAVRQTGKVTWTGAESTNWDFVSGNFKLGHSATYFVTGDSVLVDDSAVNKTITASDDFSPAAIQFANATSAITLKGTGGIAGVANLEKSGVGLLNIETIKNSYTGKTTLTNAVVQIAALSDAGLPGSLGSATVVPSNFLMNNSRLIVNAVTTNTNRGLTITGSDTINVPKSNGVVSISGQVTGTGKLVKNGTGQLSLSGSAGNTYSGGTVISGGTVALGSLAMNTSGLGSGPLTFENGGRLVMYYNTGDYNQKPTWNIVVPENHSGTLIASGRCVISGNISGAGTLTYNVPYVRADLVAGGQNFTGKLNVTTDSDGGDFRITTNSVGFPNAQIYLNNSVYMAAYASAGSSSASSTTVVKLGSLAGIAGSSVGSGNWQVGTDNRDAIFNGVIYNGAAVTKLGTGSWTLTGANQMTSGFTVSGGKLIVTNTTGSATGTGTVTVVNSATLAGTGTVGGSVIMNAGSTLSPGVTVYGTLNIGGSLLLQTGSKTLIKVGSTTNDKIAVTGSVVLRGTLELQPYNTTFTAGKSYQIFTSASATGTYDAVIPEIPGEGLAWNLSKITEGTISVDVKSGIFSPNANRLLKVYPTMVESYCHIDLSSFTGKTKFELTDFSGRIVSADILESADKIYKFDMQQHSAGIYFIRIVNEAGETGVAKIVKR